jgi:Type IV secretion system pilin
MRYLIFFIFFVFLLTTPAEASLIPCEGPDCNTCHVAQMGNSVVQLLMSFFFILFVILTAISGFKITTAGGSAGARTDAKKRYVNMFTGLIIVLIAWILVDTIMRGLLVGEEGKEGIIQGYGPWSRVECTEQVDPTVVVWAGDPENKFADSDVEKVESCNGTDCAAAKDECTNGTKPEVTEHTSGNKEVNCWNIKPTTSSSKLGNPSHCTGSSCSKMNLPCKAGCSISPDLKDKMEAFHQQAGVNGARVTEAMPPTRVHKSPCHRNGTCIDYSKAGGMTPSEVKRVIDAAHNNGLRPVYEVRTQAQKNEVVRAGVSPSDVKVLGSWISAPHFSVYGY